MKLFTLQVADRVLSMNSRIKQKIRREEFYPAFIGLFTNPLYFNRKGLEENIRKFGQRIEGKTLDVGCGTKPYEKLYASSTYIGLDICSHEDYGDRNKADTFYDGSCFPFPNGSFDSVVTTQVLEHVFKPNAFLREINRVLREGGLLLLSVPFIWEEHEQPWDYGRYSSFGLNFLLKKHGFEIIEHQRSGDDISLLFQLFISFVSRKVLSGNRYLYYLQMLFFVAPLNILGAWLSNIMPDDEDLFLDNIVLARKIIL